MLSRLAEVFAREVGADLPQYTFVFPNHRAGLFFRKYLSEAVATPVFAPEVMTINECFASLSDLRMADPLTLLVRLYDIYRRLRPDAEPIERFLYWGKMMLSDFSEIDNHLIPNVDALFFAVRDLRDIDERFRYLSDNQRNAIHRFWEEFSVSESHHPDNGLHTHFVRTWELLYPLYTQLRAGLLADGLAYDGLLHREVIEHIDHIDPVHLKAHYVFVGFNALTESERQLMLHLQAMGRADFYFDYEDERLRDPNNRASLFMQDNLRLFHSRFAVPEVPDRQLAECRLVSVSSTIGEAHEVYHILHTLYGDGQEHDFTRTAVVLPEEQLLIPLLDCFPPEVQKINVTMGYPLRATALYMPVAYPERFFDPMPDTAQTYLTRMREQLTAMRTDENAEGVYQLLTVLDKMETVFAQYPHVPISVEAAQQILRMLTMETSIPYIGEPLDGLQVMGVLETRTLSFDNLIITGFNDDLYPGRTRNNSFIPYILRKGFALPTSERQDAIFAYNFYRMLSYARRVWFITNSTADEQHSGEVSRYFYQLQWQYGVHIPQETVVSPLHTPATHTCEEVPKTEKDLLTLKRYAAHGISASALNVYLKCPKWFYYRYVQGIHEPQQDEDISVTDATLGTALHATIQRLYQPFEGKMLRTEDIVQIRRDFDAHPEADGVMALVQDDVLAAEVVRSYVRNILDFDLTQVPLHYLSSEHAYTRKIAVPEVGEVCFFGIVDRIDEQQGCRRIVDYKTGNVDFEFKDMNELFAPGKNKSQVLQTLLYCWLVDDDNATPHIYPVRRMKKELTEDKTPKTTNDTTSPLTSSSADAACAPFNTAIRIKDGEPVVFGSVREEFLDGLRELIRDIFNPDKPFGVAEKARTCELCPFAALCRG